LAFEQAYELSRRPALLYDMANALERLGRYEEALHRLNQYVPSAPEHQREAVLKRIRSLEARAEEQRRRERAAASTPAAEEPPRPPPSPGVAPQPAAPMPDSAPAASPPLLGYALGGAGLASVGVGVVFGLAASNARSDAEAQCVDSGSGVLCPASIDDQLSTADRRALVADVAIGLGLVAVGVGAYLIFSHDGGSGATTALRAAGSPDGGRVNLVTTF